MQIELRDELTRVHTQIERIRDARSQISGIKKRLGSDESEAALKEQADALLDELLAHATEERFQYRHKWRVGDLVLWDNRCLLHKANGDYDHAQTRYLYRVMLQGDQPR